MAVARTAAMAPAGESLTLRRVFPVRPEKVWRAWVDPAALRVWLDQADAPGWAAELDVRVGGRYRFAMRHPNGAGYEARGVYREVEPPRRLVFTWAWRDGASADEALVTVQLTPVAAGTELVFTLDPVVDPRERDAWRADFRRMGRLLQETGQRDKHA